MGEGGLRSHPIAATQLGDPGQVAWVSKPLFLICPSGSWGTQTVRALPVSGLLQVRLSVTLKLCKRECQEPCSEKKRHWLGGPRSVPERKGQSESRPLPSARSQWQRGAKQRGGFARPAHRRSQTEAGPGRQAPPQGCLFIACAPPGLGWTVRGLKRPPWRRCWGVGAWGEVTR